MLAIIHAIHKWQPYLVGNHFIILTNYHSLKYFLQGRAHTPFQQKWVSKLMGFDYEIQYKQGCDNQVADALSRSPLTTDLTAKFQCDSIECAAMSYPYSTWIDDLRRHVEKDTWVIEKTQKVLSDTSERAPIGNLRFQVDSGFLKYKGRIVLSLFSY